MAAISPGMACFDINGESPAQDKSAKGLNVDVGCIVDTPFFWSNTGTGLTVAWNGRVVTVNTHNTAAKLAAIAAYSEGINFRRPRAIFPNSSLRK
jgi:hypothetical protein